VFCCFFSHINCKCSLAHSICMFSNLSRTQLRLELKFFSYAQLSFQMWTDEMQETLNTKKKGDSAFKQKDYRIAIECYTQVSSSFQSFQFSFMNYVRNCFFINLRCSWLIIQSPYHTKLPDFNFFPTCFNSKHTNCI
jgi:hypothetical protein